MLITSKLEYDKLTEKDKNDNNYLVNINKSKKYFSFGKNAVKSETDKNIIIPIPEKMNNIINFWNKINNTKYLLLSKNGGQLSKNGFSKLITDIFKSTGKNISVVMIRKIFLSEKYSDINKEKKEIAQQMNHSVSVANTFYIKN